MEDKFKNKVRIEPKAKSYDEAELIEAVQKISKLLSKKFSFLYFSPEDIEQEMYTMALEGLPDYDASRPLVNFLYTHIRNRLINLKRRFYRNDPPCKVCHTAHQRGEVPKHRNKKVCTKYARWRSRNESRSKINSAGSFHSFEGASHDNTIDFLAHKDYMEILDQNLSVEARRLLLKALAGEKLPEEHRAKLLAEVKECLSNLDG